jgi:hypothetical protein
MIGAAFVLAVYRVSQGAYVPAAGLAALAAGLMLLDLANRRRRPFLKYVAWFAFALTGLSVVLTLQQMR